MAKTPENLNKYCRLCMDTSSEKMHHIFDESLSNKIIILSGLEVQNSDALPKLICRECRYQLEKSYYFRMVAKKTDARFRKHIRLVNQKKPSSVLQEGYDDDEDLNEFDETYLESYKYFDEAKKEVESLKLEFEAHKEFIIQEEVDRVRDEIAALVQPKRKLFPPKESPKKPPVLLNKCVNSPQRFQTSPMVRRKQNVEDSQQTALSEIVMEGYEIEFIPGDLDGEFQVANVEANPQIELIDQSDDADEQIEENEDSDEEYKPPQKKKPSLIKASETKPSVKSSPKLMTLKVISPSGSSSNAKKSQSETAKTDDSKEMIIEEHYFKLVEEVNGDDLDNNKEMKIFQCTFDGCNERFARRQACKTHYYNHITTQAIAVGFTCKFCQKMFKVSSALDRHERIHTGSKPFACDFEGCSKAFSQKEMLKRHKIVHMDVAPFECKICEKRFRQKEPLRQHIFKFHSEDAESKAHPFNCTICQKQFAHSSGLSRHFLIHSGRKFVCEICQKSFNDQSALKRHVNIHNK